VRIPNILLRWTGINSKLLLTFSAEAEVDVPIGTTGAMMFDVINYYILISKL
jgi:hypothetical protein